MKRILVLIWLLVASSAAFANAEGDGNSLIAQCNAALKYDDKAQRMTWEEMIDARGCMELVRGVYVTAQLWQAADTMFATKVSPTRPCLPDATIHIPQGVRIVDKYLTDHPAELHLDDAQLVLMALRDAFPCKELPTKHP